MTGELEAQAEWVLREAGLAPSCPEGVVHSGSGADLVLFAGTVVKLHHPSTSGDDLAWRLRAAAQLDAAFLPPSRDRPCMVERAGAPPRPASVWPRVRPLSAAHPNDVDWTGIAATLARLHRYPVPAGAPAHGGHTRLRRVATALADLQSADLELPEAGPIGLAGLTGLATGLLVALQTPRPAPRPALVHGDWHLGQVAATDDGWRLIDVDDLGVGDPAWDLGRPAGAWAAGQLDEPSLTALLAGYRRAGGPGLPTDGDPWPAVDLAARCSVVIATYGLLRDRPRDPELRQLLDNLVGACARMAALPG